MKRLSIIWVILGLFSALNGGCGASKMKPLGAPTDKKMSRVIESEESELGGVALGRKGRAASDSLPMSKRERYYEVVRHPRSDDHSALAKGEEPLTKETIIIQLEIILMPLMETGDDDISLSVPKVEHLALVVREFFKQAKSLADVTMIHRTFLDTLNSYPLTLGSMKRIYQELSKPLTKPLHGLNTLCDELHKQISYEDTRIGLLDIIINDLKEMEHHGSLARKEKLLRELNDGFLTLTPTGREQCILFIDDAIAKYDIPSVRRAVEKVFKKILIYPLTAQVIIKEVTVLKGEDRTIVEQFSEPLLTGLIRELQEQRDEIHARSHALTAAAEILCEE